MSQDLQHRLATRDAAKVQDRTRHVLDLWRPHADAVASLVERAEHADDPYLQRSAARTRATADQLGSATTTLARTAQPATSSTSRQLAMTDHGEDCNASTDSSSHRAVPAQHHRRPPQHQDHRSRDRRGVTHSDPTTQFTERAVCADSTAQRPALNAWRVLPRPTRPRLRDPGAA